MTTKNHWPFPHFTNTENPINFPKMTNPVQEALNSLKAQIEQERQTLLSDAKRNGVSVVHVFDEYDPKGGLTIAFRKSMPGQKSTNMVDCAVVTCSYADNFNRKIGTQLALQKWFDMDTVQLPLSSGWDNEELNGIVKRKFHALFFTE